MGAIERVSHHAAERWVERIGGTSCVSAARRLALVGADRAVTIPNRYAVTRWALTARDRRRTAQERRCGIRFRFRASAVLITGGSNVVTVLRPTDDDLATVLVWAMTRIWV